jgi:hypothetical protein
VKEVLHTQERDYFPFFRRTFNNNNNNINNNNKPDFLICENEKKSMYVNRTYKFGDRNVIKKEAEMIVKYKYLKIEI